MQLIICIVIVAVFIGVCFFLYARQLAIRKDVKIADIESEQEVCDYVMRQLADMLKRDNFDTQDDLEYEALKERKLAIETAFNDCVYGKEGAALTVKEIIYNVLAQKFQTLDELYEIYDFENRASLPPHWKFEILIEHLYPIHKKNTMNYLIRTYNWARVHYDIEDGTVPSYAVDVEDLDEAYNEEIYEDLTKREALSVAATLVYEKIKGFGCIDTLRRQNIDGINLGASGSIMPNDDPIAQMYRAPRSVWIYYKGMYLHLRFLSMESEQEMRRVVTLLCRYNNPGPLTEKRGYIVNTMEDQSRILALRPPAAEFWSCFIRKFVLSARRLDDLIDPVLISQKDGKEVYDPETGEKRKKYNNAFIPLKTVELLMRGQVTTSFTGRQGSGKTTMMAATIAKVDARFTVRILEMAPELYLRELYPQRNILSVAETPYVTAAQLQDALKKSDAALSIVGEVATDVVAARMIQMGQVASIFTIFSHHANRAQDLVNAITNSVVAASGGSATPETVEPQVIDVIKVDCHLDYDVNGNRYIERITEIVRLDSQPYPERLPNESAEDYKIRLDKEYYTRQTDRLHFTSHDIVRFDTATFTYYTVDWFTPELTKHIFERLPVEVRHEWKEWVVNTWDGKYDAHCLKSMARPEE